MPDIAHQETGSVCAVIIATSVRLDQLRKVSLPSIGRQICPPTLVVLVADGGCISRTVAREFEDLVQPAKLITLSNRRAPGAAGAWNTGLEYLTASRFAGFVAILDDDDEWDPNHVSLNLTVARQISAAVVISGLRILRDGIPIAREPPIDLTDREFLYGNPGWQGSNTFVALSALLKVRGFRDGMASANDRDLAIRLLRHPGVRVGYTGTWTATWHLSTTRQTLSSPHSDAKLRGLRWFWQIYGREMLATEVKQFFARANDLFRIPEAVIVAPGKEVPPHEENHGDLNCCEDELH